MALLLQKVKGLSRLSLCDESVSSNFARLYRSESNISHEVKFHVLASGTLRNLAYRYDTDGFLLPFLLRILPGYAARHLNTTCRVHAAFTPLYRIPREHPVLGAYVVLRHPRLLYANN
jgi:hypothetical protein